MSGARKFGLIVFGAILVVLFAGIAIAQGVTKPSVPSGDIILVEEVPDDRGKISQEDYNRAFIRTWKGGGLQAAPKEGDAQYEQVREAAINDLLDQAWLTGQAAEMGITATDREIENELATIKKQQFPTKKAFEEFLKTSGFTEDEVRDRVELQVLSRKIQSAITESVTEVPEKELEAYYEQSKQSFTTPENREIRLIVTDQKSDAEKALEELGDDPTDEQFAKVAKEFSVHASKSEGGEATATENAFPDPAGSGIMSAEEGVLEGPVKAGKQFYIFKVNAITPEETKSFDEVREQIKGQLLPALQQQSMQDFVSDYNSTWTSRTFCDDDYTTSRCENYEGDGRLTAGAGSDAPLADEKCFEAGAAKFATSGEGVGCPALIALPKPMAPGGNVTSVPGIAPPPASLPQRPIKPSDVAAAEGGATGPAGFDPSQLGGAVGQ